MINYIRNYLTELLITQADVNINDIIIKNTRQDKEFNKDKYRLPCALIWTEKVKSQKLDGQRYDGGSGQDCLYKREGSFIVEIVDTFKTIEDRIDKIYEQIEDTIDNIKSNTYIDLEIIEEVREEIKDDKLSISLEIKYVILMKHYSLTEC